MNARDRSIAPHAGRNLARVEGPPPDGALVPELVDVSAFAAELTKYRESGNFISRWLNGRLSEAKSAQEARMIEGFAKQWQAIQSYYDGVAGALEAAYKAERAHGKLGLAQIENRRDRQLAEMEAQSTIARRYFEAFTLQAEELKEALLNSEVRQRELDVRLQENELRLSRLDREIRAARRPSRQSTRRRRWNPKETAERILSGVSDLDRALRHTDQLFSQRDPEMAGDVKQEIREMFRQMWRQQLDGQHEETSEGDEDGWDEGGDENDEGSHIDLDQTDGRR